MFCYQSNIDSINLLYFFKLFVCYWFLGHCLSFSVLKDTMDELTDSSSLAVSCREKLDLFLCVKKGRQTFLTINIPLSSYVTTFPRFLHSLFIQLQLCKKKYRYFITTLFHYLFVYLVNQHQCESKLSHLFFIIFFFLKYLN